MNLKLTLSLKKFNFYSIVFLCLLCSFAISGNCQTAVDLFQKGVEKRLKGDPKVAITELNQALTPDPNYAEAYCIRGIAKYDLKDFNGAINDCSKAC